MDCQKCKTFPAFYCACSNLYICDTHLRVHLTTPGSHPLENLVSIPQPDIPRILSGLQDRIISLEKLKQKILKKTQKLIKLIETKANQILETINNQMKTYKRFLMQKQFRSADLENLESSLSSEQKPLKFSLSSLKQSVKESFSQEFFNQDENQNKNDSQFKDFLQTNNGGFWCLAVSEDGNTLVTGSIDSSVRVWDLTTKTQSACFIEHESDVRCLALSQNAQWAVSGSHDRRVILWNLLEKKSQNVYLGHSGAVFTVALSNDCSFIVSGSLNNEIIMWKSDSNISHAKMQADSSVFCGIILEKFYFSCVGSYLETWNLNNFTKTKSKKIHDSNIRCAKISNRKDFIITCSDDASLKLTRFGTLDSYATLLGHNSIITSVTLTRDDNLAISGSVIFEIIVWRISSNSKIFTFDFHKDRIYGLCTFNDLIYSASRDSRIGISRISTKKFESFLNLQPFSCRSECKVKNFIAFGSQNDVIIWDLSKNQKIATLQGHSEMVQSTCISINTKMLLTTSEGEKNNLIAWNFKNFSKITNLDGHKSSVFCVDISKDEQFGISGDHDGSVILWDLARNTKGFTFTGHQGNVYSVKFTSNKMFAASGGEDRKLFIWNINNRQIHAVLGSSIGIILQVFITSDDIYVVSSDRFNGIYVFNISNRRLEFNFRDKSQSEFWLSKYRDLKPSLASYLF